LEARRAYGRRPRRGAAAGLACLAGLAVGACGGDARRDRNERAGSFKVAVVEAKFPQRQKLAKGSRLVIVVKNLDSKPIPDVAVTLRGLEERIDTPGVADPRRPVFVVDGVPKRLGGIPETQEAAPGGAQTAYVDTWTLGRLRPGEKKAFRWSVTAVKAGPYHLRYSVAASLDGKARAVDPSGSPPAGGFSGTISGAAPATRVADDGRTVVRGTR
jgi:hypothetical protein